VAFGVLGRDPKDPIAPLLKSEWRKKRAAPFEADELQTFAIGPFPNNAGGPSETD